MGGWNNVGSGGGGGGGGATEATQLRNEALLTDIDTNTNGSVVSTVTVRATGAGSIPAGAKRGSVLNIGNANGSWNGQTIDAGVGIPFGKGDLNDEYGAINYDGTGTTLLIEYTI